MASCWCSADQWSDDEDWALLGFLQSTSLSSTDINQAHRAALPHRNILSPLNTYCMFVCVYEGETEVRGNEATHLHLFYGNNLFRKNKPNPIASRRTFIIVSNYIQWIWRNCNIFKNCPFVTVKVVIKYKFKMEIKYNNKCFCNQTIKLIKFLVWLDIIFNFIKFLPCVC